MPRTTPRPSLNAREFLPEKREHTHWPWLREPSGEGRLTDQLSPIQNNSWGVGRKFTVSWDLGFSILQCGTHPPKPGLWREDLLERRPMRVLRTQPVGVQSTKRKVTHQPAMIYLSTMPAPSSFPCTARAALLQPNSRATARQLSRRTACPSRKRAPAPCPA